jgi:hypothetical protein
MQRISVDLDKDVANQVEKDAKHFGAAFFAYFSPYCLDLALARFVGQAAI